MPGPSVTSRTDFEEWLTHMPAALSFFLNNLPERIRQKLDYSPESLNVLEAWLLETYPSTQSMLAQDQAAKVGGAARYIGETIRKALGGHWDIRFDDPQFAFYGMPILTGFGERSSPLAPLTLATAAADRRTGKFLTTVLENQRRRFTAR